MPEKVILGTLQTAAFFGVSDRTLTSWRANGCPCEKRGKWDLRAVLDWWLENVYEGGPGENGEPGTLADAKLSYWQARSERERLRVDREQGELIPRVEVVSAWAERVVEVCAGLENLAFRLPGALEGKTREDMAELIRLEVRALRDAYSRNGKYCEEGTPDGR